MKIVRPLKLVMTAELDDGSIRDVIIPFSLREGIELVDSLPHESLGTNDSLKILDPLGTESDHSFHPLQMGRVSR
jgi:hypothetical protein